MNEEGPAAADSAASTEAGGDGTFPNLLTRFVQAFVSPGALFERLRERPLWVGAVILIVLLSVGSTVLLPDAALLQFMSDQMGPQATTEQIGRFMPWFKVWAVVITVASIPIVAGVLILIYNVFTGGEATYRQLFSASAHAFLIYAVGGLIAVMLTRARGEMVVLSMNHLMPGLDEGYLFRLLWRINVFSLWTAAVLGVAVSRLYPGRSAGRAAGVIMGLYLALAAVFALFGGAR
jgi:hypothetical protein